MTLPYSGIYCVTALACHIWFRSLVHHHFLAPRQIATAAFVLPVMFQPGLCEFVVQNAILLPVLVERLQLAFLTAQMRLLQQQQQLQTISQPVKYRMISMCITTVLVNVCRHSCAQAFIPVVYASSYCTA